MKSSLMYGSSFLMVDKVAAEIDEALPKGGNVCVCNISFLKCEQFCLVICLLLAGFLFFCCHRVACPNLVLWSEAFSVLRGWRWGFSFFLSFTPIGPCGNTRRKWMRPFRHRPSSWEGSFLLPRKQKKIKRKRDCHYDRKSLSEGKSNKRGHPVNSYSSPGTCTHMHKYTHMAVGSAAKAMTV